MYTDQRRAPNYFVPDAQMLFHVTGICDQMMNSTERFLRSAPAWIPIVSQLYISVLWIVMILKVHVNSGYGAFYASFYSDLETCLKIGECMIPGPLVPFFQSLAAVNGPYEWIGDVLPVLPGFIHLWEATQFHPQSGLARQIPLPLIMLDQLYYFATRVDPQAANASTYTTFQWYRNVFSQGLGTYDRLNRIGPQSCGSLFTTQAQYDSARTFWASAFGTGFTRINAADGQPVLTTFFHLLGFQSQDSTWQVNWFQHVVIVMQKYCQYFNGSVALKSISPVGIGAVVIRGTPNSNASARNWVFPANNSIEPFTSTRFAPLREIPAELGVIFHHADPEIEEQAEQYAILCHTNINWSNLNPQNQWAAIPAASCFDGEYWNMTCFRHSPVIRFKVQYAQLIASRYHQQAANRAD